MSEYLRSRGGKNDIEIAMKGFIHWFVQADIQFMDGDVVDYRTACHAGDMPDDQISICRMEDRDNWNPEYILDSSTVKEIQIFSSHAVVLMSDDVILKFERAYKEKPADPELYCSNEQCESNNGDAERLFTNSLVVDKHGNLPEYPYGVDGFECVFCHSEADWQDS